MTGATAQNRLQEEGMNAVVQFITRVVAIWSELVPSQRELAKRVIFLGVLPLTSKVQDL